MSAEYPDASWVGIPGFGFPTGAHGRNGQSARWIVLHGTASPGATAQNIANYFAGDPNNGTHFVIGKDGQVIQMVLLGDAAYGNGGPTATELAQHKYADFWDAEIAAGVNLNLVTVSIEHCKDATDNSDQLTQAQQDASFRLVAWLCKTLGIPPRQADENGGITGHFSINGIERVNCPGPYPWNALWSYLGGNMAGIPDGWHESDDHSQLIAPNGHFFVRGFKAAVEAGDWDAEDWPLEEERSVAQMEISGPNAMPGVIQTTRKNRWLYSPDKNNGQPFLCWTGYNLLLTEQALAAAQAEIAQLKAQPPAPTPPPAPQPADWQAAVVSIDATLKTLLGKPAPVSGGQDALAAFLHSSQ